MIPTLAVVLAAAVMAAPQESGAPGSVAGCIADMLQRFPGVTVVAVGSGVKRTTVSDSAIEKPRHWHFLSVRDLVQAADDREATMDDPFAYTSTVPDVPANMLMPREAQGALGCPGVRRWRYSQTSAADQD